MRTASDHISGPSPIMIAVIVGSSVLSVVGMAIELYSEAPATLEWSSRSQEFKTLLGVFLFILATMTGACWMMLNLSITIRADKEAIEARIFPFMRSYRQVLFSSVEKINVIDFSGGLSKYGGVGYKNKFGKRTSNTLHLKGHALAIYFKDKTELHVETSKVEEWKRFVESFENSTL
ncbi:MAG: hypothetical protein ACI9FN_002086 [Saprospiraceae bacterium]|jgi:hypothetical protein